MIRGRRFRDLFLDVLGWDAADDSPLSLSFERADEKQEFTAAYIAQKRGFVVCEAQCKAMPPAAVRQRLQRQISKSHHEHLLIFSATDGEQKWMVAQKRPEKTMRSWEDGFYPGQKPESLLQKVEGLLISMKEEGDLTLVDVIERVEEAFAANAERVTRRFYKEFRKHLKEFQKFISGLRERVSREQYASLMLNRLMFIYFIQKKNFLDGDPHYLRNHLKRTQKDYGKDKFFQNFYRYFLLELFHRGLGAREESRSDETKKRIGKVPYLNGGLFDQHALEREHGEEIQIADDAFESLFKFFDKYHWHLDDSRTASGSDINPDVIGYIFEKYINERAKMGAYYTREDITDYIARNTILPHLLRRAKDGCKVAFDSEKGTIWRLLRENPEQYIYPAMQKGANLPDSKLPEHIRAGLDSQSQIPDLLKRREKWNAAADEEWALPSETWREALERRHRCKALIADIKAGGVCDIADLTARNLDIEMLTLDALKQHEGSDFISAFYTAVAGQAARENSTAKERRGIAVLDPACGSGAFLFAALKVLKPLYEACVKRMHEFVAEADQLGKTKHHPNFRAVLDDMRPHPNKDYWIYRSIILGNLFGADIMPEAAEVAKLRLFLKLAATVEEPDDEKPNMGLEPLPDIDFNIRSGNALVGFASIAEFKKQAGIVLDLTQRVSHICDRAGHVGIAYRRFFNKQRRNAISDIDTQDSAAAKSALQVKLLELNGELNQYLAVQYGVPHQISDLKMSVPLAKWIKSHKPFHWATEFYDIVESGGFDVVIGNPPYVKYKEDDKDGSTTVGYRVQGYTTEKAQDLYSFVVERGLSLLQPKGDIGMITPLSIAAADRCKSLRDLFAKHSVYSAHFADRPGCLFVGVHQMLTIFLAHRSAKKGAHSTSFIHWNAQERENIFKKLSYAPSVSVGGAWGKIANKMESDIFHRTAMSQRPLSAHIIPSGELVSVCAGTGGYYLRAFNTRQESDQYKNLYCHKDKASAVAGIINSNLFYWVWRKFSNCRHLRQSDIARFIVPLSDEVFAALQEPSREAVAALLSTKEFRKGVKSYYQYRPAKVKSYFDEIDKILAKHYGFSAEELDYIINYDYKYRMGGGDE